MSQPEVLIGIHGATGRMGARLVQLIAEGPGLALAAALERADHPKLGADAGELAGVGPLGVPLAAVGAVSPETAVDAMIDFSTPAAAPAIAEWCVRRRVPLVVGTTGLGDDHLAALEAASAVVPVLVAPNMSRAVNLLMKLVGDAARALGPAADVAIVERHHRTKKDAPSGTALRLAEFVRRGAALAAPRPGAPSGAPADVPVRVDVHALRLADSPGEHVVIFGLAGETIELGHRALNRDGFARGALEAARFLVGKPPRAYLMEDVLGWQASDGG